MMLHYKHYISGLLLLLLASCSQQQFMEEPSSRSPYETVEISAGMPQTRMTTEEEDKVLHFLWEKGDLITLATASQQLPYVANNSGASTTFHSAYGSSVQPDDVLKNIEGSVVYARYPYNNKAPINMDSLTTLVASGSPFLYAVDTIKDGKLNLHYHHAMAYLRFHVKHDPFPTDRELDVSVGACLPNGNEEELISLGRFDYRTRSIIPIEASIELEVSYINFMDSVSLFPISPVQSSSEITFELCCRNRDEDQEEFYFDKWITKELPEGGLQAGHVYDVYLDYRENANTPTDPENPEREIDPFLLDLYNWTDGQNWTNNTNWLSDKPYSEWYGVTTDANGNITAINLSNNNLVGGAILILPPTLTSFNLDNNKIRFLQLGSLGSLSLSLDNCFPEALSLSCDKIEVMHCDSVGISADGHGQLIVNDCNIKYIISDSYSSKVTIQNSTVESCRVKTDTLSFENSYATCHRDSHTRNFVNISNSTCTGFGPYIFAGEGAKINLHNATLINPHDYNYHDYYFTISNVTCSLKSGEWDDFIQSSYSQFEEEKGTIQMLTELYNSTGGKNWTNNTNWLSDKPYSEWYGISVGTDGNIVSIDLSNNNLIGTEVKLGLPKSIVSFTIDNNSIDQLYINGNGQQLIQLNNCIKDKLDAWNIKQIDISNCNSIGIEVVQCERLAITDCTLNHGMDYGIYGRDIEEAIIKNCTVTGCMIWAINVLTLEETNCTNTFSCSIKKQLNILNSSCSNLNKGGYGSDFYDDTEIILQNASLINPNNIENLTISNVTRTLTGAEWDAFIQEYANAQSSSSSGASAPRRR